MTDCDHCQEPVTGTPATDPGDPLGREFHDECLTAAAEASHGAFAGTEFN